MNTHMKIIMKLYLKQIFCRLARDNINNLGNMHLWATTIKIVQFAATIFRCFIFLPLPLFVSAAKKELSCAFPSSPLNAYKCHWHTLHHDERSRCCQRQVMRQCHPSFCWISKLFQSFLHTDSLPQILELTRKLRKDGKKMQISNIWRLIEIK